MRARIIQCQTAIFKVKYKYSKIGAVALSTCSTMRKQSFILDGVIRLQALVGAVSVGHGRLFQQIHGFHPGRGSDILQNAVYVKNAKVKITFNYS